MLCPGKDSQGLSSSQGEGAHVNGLHSEELSQLREEVEELRRQHTLQHTQLSDKDSLINTLVCVWGGVNHISEKCLWVIPPCVDKSSV